MLQYIQADLIQQQMVKKGGTQQMPLVIVEADEGRTIEQKRGL